MSKKVALVTDSTADIPLPLAVERGIHVVPLHLIWGDQNLRDGVDITSGQFYERLVRDSELPTTSQANPNEFAEAFQQARDAADAEAVVAVTISSRLSSTYDSARQGAQRVDFPVHVIDSRSASGGLGVVALALADLRDAGASAGEMLQAAGAIVARSRAFLALDTLEYLHRGGRINGAQRMFGTILQIKPILHVVEGRLEPYASVRTRGRAVRLFAETIGDLIAQSGGPPEYVILLYSTDPADLDPVEEEIVAHGRPKRLIRTTASPAVGVHTGPGAIGIGLLLP